jgi:hypothetical protein
MASLESDGEHSRAGSEASVGNRFGEGANGTGGI